MQERDQEHYTEYTAIEALYLRVTNARPGDEMGVGSEGVGINGSDNEDEGDDEDDWEDED